MREIQSGEGLTPQGVEGAMGARTLQLLRELLDVAQESGPTLARRADLSHTELTALDQLSRHPWGPGDLARHLGVTSAAATGIVDRLVARGHVERQPHEADRRRTQVVLTDSGRTEVLGHLMPMFVALDELDRSLSDEERAAVERYLAGAIDAVRRIL